MPPSRGLRGVLDSIVSDGMRVAAEVRKRMDEVERQVQEREAEREREGEGDGDGGEEGEGLEEGRASYGGEAERRSVREGDREVLEGAEAVVGVGVGEGKGGALVDLEGLMGGEVKEVVEFER